jgi:hypothetical protein
MAAGLASRAPADLVLGSSVDDIVRFLRSREIAVGAITEGDGATDAAIDLAGFDGLHISVGDNGYSSVAWWNEDEGTLRMWTPRRLGSELLADLETAKEAFRDPRGAK